MAIDDTMTTGLLSSFIPEGVLVIILLLVLAMIGIWVFTSLLFRDLAKKLGVPHDWASMSWFGFTIPYLMANMARKPWWPVIVIMPISLLLAPLQALGLFFVILSGLVSLGFAGYMIYLNWKICELRNRPGWWAILSLIAVILGAIFVIVSTSLVILAVLLFIFAFVWQIIMWSILAWGK